LRGSSESICSICAITSAIVEHAVGATSPGSCSDATSAMLTEIAAVSPSPRPVGEADDEAQGRPGRVDGTHLVIDEPDREPGLAYDAIAQVRLDA